MNRPHLEASPVQVITAGFDILDVKQQLDQRLNASGSCAFAQP